ncbi:DNA polymerase PolB subunit 2 [Candidatus Methanobinarius endosymbioticus]|uniref:DNA-directed DNA polymerase n=1 Tax=Candidatus Methanobinarius endosymbioticus TaxID=2006182 RepID=A0A366M9K3_9EURY|nr:DNA polymerase PolB subunit 2 [Candidatus Methanobinarius endosymbioticus]
MVTESNEQLALEKKIKSQANKFLVDFNGTLPESMELEYEGFYRRGFFVSKKRYAVVEDGAIIAKGLELVRRDWAPVAKDTQQGILLAILKDGDVDKAVEIIKKILKKVKTGTVPMKDMIIHTQITKKLDAYKQIGPHVVAAQRLEKKGMKIDKGTIIQYVVVKGKGPISQRAIPFEDAEKYEYDPDYYIDNQIIPAVSRIMESFGYTQEKIKELGEKERQKTLDSFF